MNRKIIISVTPAIRDIVLIFGLLSQIFLTAGEKREFSNKSVKLSRFPALKNGL